MITSHLQKPSGDGFLLHKKWICGSLCEDRWLNKPQNMKILFRPFFTTERYTFCFYFWRKIGENTKIERPVPFQSSDNNADKSTWFAKSTTVGCWWEGKMWKLCPALSLGRSDVLFVSISEVKLEISSKLKDKTHFKIATIFDRQGFVIAKL